MRLGLHDESPTWGTGPGRPSKGGPARSGRRPEAHGPGCLPLAINPSVLGEYGSPPYRTVPTAAGSARLGDIPVDEVVVDPSI